MKFKLHKLFPYILYLLITIILFGNALIPSANQILKSGDMRHIYYPYREFLQKSIMSGQLPFWNPYLFSGLPFIAHPYTEFFYPTTLPLLFLPTNIYYSFILAFHIFIAGISMYYLLKKFTDRYSAFLGGCVFAFNGYFASRVYAGHIDYVISTALIPFIFMKAYEYIVENNRKSLFWGSLVLCFQIFTGLVIMTVYIAFILLFFFLVYFIRNKINFFHAVKKIFIFFLSGIGLSAIYLLPCYEFITSTIRGMGLSYNLAAYGSATWQTLVMFLSPNQYGSDFFANNFYHGAPPDFAGHIFFIGITPLLLIFFGLIYQIKKISDPMGRKGGSLKLFGGFTIITVMFLLISLGPNSPVNLHLFLWKIFSIYKTTRLPVRHLIIAVFTLSVLAGLSAHLIKSKIIKLMLIAIILIELIPFGKQLITLTEIRPLIPTKDVILEKIVKDKDFVRILPDFTLNSPVREEISFASPLIYKYFSTSGYTPAILSNYYDFVDKINGNISSSVYLYSSEILPTNPILSGVSFLNTRYIIVDNSADMLGSQKNNYKLLDETYHYRIYENKKYFPRFFFVPVAKVYNSRKELADNLSKDQNEFDHLITLQSQDSKTLQYTPDCSGNVNDAKIEILKYDLNSITLRINSQCNGFISTSESNYPGWAATIDGKPTKLLTSNLSFRAIYIPKGTHIITMKYQPTVYIIGGLISLISFGGLMYLLNKKMNYNRFNLFFG